MRRSLAPVLVAVLCAFPAAAGAQLPAPTPPPTPPPAPAPRPGKASIKVTGGQATKKLRYVATRAAFRVSGRVTPFVAGQVVVLDVSRHGKVIARHRVRVRSGGLISVRVRTRHSGLVKVRFRHAATPQQAAFRSRARRVKAVSLSAGQGSRGTKVLLLQRGLAGLGFAVPRTGVYDGGTSRAVLAFRKVNSMGRTGFASTRVYSAVLRGRGAFRPRFRNAGRHVEFDWSHQVLALIGRNGRPHRVYHASSGKPSTPTVFGTFHFYRRQPGTNSHGMVDSTYFVGGYAIHGYASVPAYAASHGCIRVPIPNARDIYNAISLGERIDVYR